MAQLEEGPVSHSEEIANTIYPTHLPIRMVQLDVHRPYLPTRVKENDFRNVSGSMREDS